MSSAALAVRRKPRLVAEVVLPVFVAKSPLGNSIPIRAANIHEAAREAVAWGRANRAEWVVTEGWAAEQGGIPAAYGRGARESSAQEAEA